MTGNDSLLEARPPDHFVIETVGVECPVYTDAALDLRGRLAAAYDGRRAIFLREWDETVLLHEVLHRIFELQNETPLSQEQEEVLVGRIEKTLYAMGWRWTENHPWAVVDGKAIVLTPCPKPDGVAWDVSKRTKWARDVNGRCYCNSIGTWHRAQEGL